MERGLQRFLGQNARGLAEYAATVEAPDRDANHA